MLVKHASQFNRFLNDFEPKSSHWRHRVRKMQKFLFPHVFFFYSLGNKIKELREMHLFPTSSRAINTGEETI